MPENSTQMLELQHLHNKMDKTVLNLPNSASSSGALNTLKWCTLADKWEFHRCCLAFKCFNHLIDFNLDNSFKASDIHSYNTRNRNFFRLPSAKTRWGQQTTQYLLLNDWNSLPSHLKNLSTFPAFKRGYLKNISH